MRRNEDRSGPDAPADVLQFGPDRPAAGRWRSRALLAGLVLITALVVVIRVPADHQHKAGDRAASRIPPVRVTSAGHRLLGVRARWQLFVRGPDDLTRIQLATGRITRTYVPPLETASPAIAFVIGAHEAVIRPADLVPAYVVPDGGQARLLTGPLAGDGPLIPGPAGSQATWVTAGPPTLLRLSMVTLSGHRSGQAIRFPPDGPQLPATAVSDGRGDVLVTTGSFAVYDAGPGWDRPVPGNVIAVGPENWLAISCDRRYLHCRNEVINAGDGARRMLPGAAVEGPYYFAWPPDGVIAPDGSTAAVPEEGRGQATTLHLINLRTGATKDLGVLLALPGTSLPFGTSTSEDSMAWSPDSRWLFAATVSGKLVAIDTRSDQVKSLRIRLPPVQQVAVRP
jgi:hypothetical protein